MERNTQHSNIKYKFIDRDGDIWDIERNSIPQKNNEFVYWLAVSKKRKKYSMRETTYPKLIKKLNKFYGRKNILNPFSQNVNIVSNWYPNHSKA
jgi:hypothetical protein